MAYQYGGIAATSNILALKNIVNNATDLLVRIYPNPTRADASAIFYAVGGKILVAKIIDQHGKQLLSTKTQTINGWNKMTFSLATFPAAMYYLVINVGGIEKACPILKL